MAVAANTQYTLGVDESKGSVAVAVPGVVTASQVGIAFGSTVPVTSPQQLAGRIIECLDQALSSLASGPATVHMALTDVVATVDGTPGTDDITLKIGTGVTQSHKLNRTTRTLLESVLEAAKS